MGITYAIAIVFPTVTAFYIVFSFLEDTGYLPRLEVMMNRLFSLIGLNGKAVIPIVLGFGCGTMAAIVTRILETRRERIIATLILALGIPCAPQMGLILGMFARIGFVPLVLFFAAPHRSADRCRLARLEAAAGADDGLRHGTAAIPVAATPTM